MVRTYTVSLTQVSGSNRLEWWHTFAATSSISHHQMRDWTRNSSQGALIPRVQEPQAPEPEIELGESVRANISGLGCISSHMWGAWCPELCPCANGSSLGLSQRAHARHPPQTETQGVNVHHSAPPPSQILTFGVCIDETDWVLQVASGLCYSV